MKKIILVALVITTISLLSSCKKEYVCKCSKTYTGSSSSTTSDYSQYTFKDTRTRAESRCNEHATSGSDLFGDYSINCQIQ